MPHEVSHYDSKMMLSWRYILAGTNCMEKTIMEQTKQEIFIRAYGDYEK